MVMVPRNSTAEGFAYIRQSKRVMIAIKTERTQIHFLSDVLVAVVSLDLKVSNGSLRRRRNLIAVSNVCEAAPRFLFDAPNGLDESVIGRAFGFPFNPDQSRRVLNPGTQAVPWRTGWRKNGRTATATTNTKSRAFWYVILPFSTKICFLLNVANHEVGDHKTSMRSKVVFAVVAVVIA